MAAQQFEVQITTDNNVIICNVKDGKVRGGNVKGSPYDRVHFVGTGGTKFTLAFQDFPEGTADWPFVEAQPAWPVAQFMGTLKPLPPPAPPPPKYFKYTITVGNLAPLDPIIIVDN